MGNPIIGETVYWSKLERQFIDQNWTRVDCTKHRDAHKSLTILKNGVRSMRRDILINNQLGDGAVKLMIFELVSRISSLSISLEIVRRWMRQTSLIIYQNWFMYWLGAARQQAIAWDDVDPDLCHHMASLGHPSWENTPFRGFWTRKHHFFNRNRWFWGPIKHPF